MLSLMSSITQQNLAPDPYLALISLENNANPSITCENLALMSLAAARLVPAHHWQCGGPRTMELGGFRRANSLPQRNILDINLLPPIHPLQYH